MIEFGATMEEQNGPFSADFARISRGHVQAEFQVVGGGGSSREELRFASGLMGFRREMSSQG